MWYVFKMMLMMQISNLNCIVPKTSYLLSSDHELYLHIRFTTWIRISREELRMWRLLDAVICCPERSGKDEQATEARQISLAPDPASRRGPLSVHGGVPRSRLQGIVVARGRHSELAG